MLPPALISPWLPLVLAHAQLDYPSECVGVLLSNPKARSRFDLRFMACRNALDWLVPTTDPVKPPITPSMAFMVEGPDRKEISRYLLRGWTVALIYHSHIEAPPTFSDLDRQFALTPHGPAWPDAVYLIVSVRDQGNGVKATELAAYAWDAAAVDFREVSLA